jgi:hypothetical protein
MFKTIVTSLVLSFLLLFGAAGLAHATEGEVLGIHILHPYELENAQQLLKVEAKVEDDGEENSDGRWHYFTIPLSLADTEQPEAWQQLFDQAKAKQMIPIVRLVTRFEDGSWQVPNRKEVTSQINFLGRLDWPTDQKIIIIYNEPNQSHEWSGQVDPVSYTQVLRFAADWAHTENKDFVVLPAGLDLAAPNGSTTREAFWFLDQMLAADPEILSVIDYWNSHSYPNPGFSSSPERTDKNSLRGFQHELAYLKAKTGRDFEVFITETGWVDNGVTGRWLAGYYQYAYQHIWSDARIKAVTPFVLQGDPGPFSGFTFLTQEGKQTRQYQAYQNIVRQAGS